MKGGQGFPVLGGGRKKGGQIVLGGSGKYNKKGGQGFPVLGGGNQCGMPMSGGSFAEVSGSAGGQLTAGNGMGVSGAGEIATGAKLGSIAASATLMGNVDVGKESLVVTQNGGGRRKRGGSKRGGSKRSSAKHKKGGSKHKKGGKTHKKGGSKKGGKTHKRGGSKRKSRKY